jgi:hypothetical protein
VIDTKGQSDMDADQKRETYAVVAQAKIATLLPSHNTKTEINHHERKKKKKKKR